MGRLVVRSDMAFYTFGEGIVQSGVFNFTDWLRWQVGVIENLVDFGVDVGAGIHLAGNDEITSCRRCRRCRSRYRRRPPINSSAALQQVDTLMGPTPQSVGDIILTPVGAITDALVNANEEFFDVAPV